MTYTDSFRTQSLQDNEEDMKRTHTEALNKDLLGSIEKINI